MSALKLTPEDIEILNSRIGLKHLLADRKLNYEKALRLVGMKYGCGNYRRN